MPKQSAEQSVPVWKKQKIEAGRVFVETYSFDRKLTPTRPLFQRVVSKIAKERPAEA